MVVGSDVVVFSVVELVVVAIEVSVVSVEAEVAAAAAAASAAVAAGTTALVDMFTKTRNRRMIGGEEGEITPYSVDK